MTATSSLPIPTPEPRRRSIWEMSFDTDFILYPDSPTLPHVLEDLDLDDITKQGISRVSSFKHQEYTPSMLMYHPYDAKAYPEPAEWEDKMFHDLASLPSQASAPSVTSTTSVNTTAAAPPASRRGSVLLTPSSGSVSFSRSDSLSRSNSSSAERSCRRQEATGYPANRRLSALLASFSFCRSQESLSQQYQHSRRYSREISPSRMTSRTSLSMATTSTTASSKSASSSMHRRRVNGKRNTAQLLSHMGECHSHYRMDGHSKDLQGVVAGIPVSAFIHPKMHIPGAIECGPVEDDGGYDDAYPLRMTRLWAFDGPKLPIEIQYDWDDAIESCESEPIS
ncbi:hypothetical protein H072_6112 [Dactylellina haptotyla CBS 200.50]|uniref:Uncharacterized protein n=1 Tax=Dactylellina haptotyla (strain CBS 200.50) TaxID=1284197 RepID=S8AAX3_DACHA|nr:hypothetical protein H072_6112 [Dactylellina haptotyla CBS 200.50]